MAIFEKKTLHIQPSRIKTQDIKTLAQNRLYQRSELTNG